MIAALMISATSGSLTTLSLPAMWMSPSSAPLPTGCGLLGCASTLRLVSNVALSLTFLTKAVLSASVVCARQTDGPEATADASSASRKSFAVFISHPPSRRPVFGRQLLLLRPLRGLVGRAARRAHVHEFVEHVEPEGRAERDGEHGEEPADEVLRQPRPPRPAVNVGPLPADELAEQRVLLVRDDIARRRLDDGLVGLVRVRVLDRDGRAGLLRAGLRLLDDGAAEHGVFPQTARDLEAVGVREQRDGGGGDQGPDLRLALVPARGAIHRVVEPALDGLLRRLQVRRARDHGQQRAL